MAASDRPIEIENASKVFRDGTVALDEVTVEVERGEVFGFIGPNGAGKTTAIRLLFDLLRPTSGRVAVFGMDPRRQGSQVRSRVGYLPGELHLDERLSARATLLWFARLRGLDEDRYGLELAERFDLPLDRPLRDLSKGNKQKVGLIQALLHRPELVVLDEPTSGLDPILQHTFVELVEESRAGGTTFFISSHVLSELEHVADRVGMIRRGRLLAVEQMGKLKRHSAHRVAIRFASDVPAGLFDGVEGVHDLQVKGSLARMRVVGTMDAVVKAASQHSVLDMTSVEPDLEEIFMSFYDNDGEGQDA